MDSIKHLKIFCFIVTHFITKKSKFEIYLQELYTFIYITYS